MTTFTVGDPVVLLADHQGWNADPSANLGTVVHDNYATDTVTICDDATGRIYDAPYSHVAYPEGTPLHSTRFFAANRTALLRRAPAPRHRQAHLHRWRTRRPPPRRLGRPRRRRPLPPRRHHSPPRRR
jgi:hypothetical protein